MKLKFLFCLCLILSYSVTVCEASEQYRLSVAEYQIKIYESNYHDEGFPILNYQGRTYAPMRSMLEAAGFKVDFTNGVVTVESGGRISVAAESPSSQPTKKDYILKRADYKITIDGKDYIDDSFPILNYEGRTYAPMRSMLEAAGLNVNFENGIAIIEAPANFTADNPNITDYMAVREVFENTSLIPSFNIGNRTIEIYNDKKELLLVIPKEYTHEFGESMMILKSYYESDLKLLIDQNK